MGTGYCNCVTLRAKVRLAIEVIEDLRRHNNHTIEEEMWKLHSVLIELKKEIGA